MARARVRRDDAPLRPNLSRTIEFVPDLELSEYSVLEPLDNEEYEVPIQVNDPDAQLTRLSLLLTDGTSVSVTSDQPTNQ